MKTLLSLFDHSGGWSLPYKEAGWKVHQWDIKLSEFMDINLIDSAETALDLFEDVDGIIAGPPCTDFTCSGNRYWKIKDEDGRTWKSLELVTQVQRLVDLYSPTDPDFYKEGGTFFWAVENPVGRLGSLSGMGKPSMYFDPWFYAGNIEMTEDQMHRLNRIRLKDGIGITKEENDFILWSNAYTKKTCLWGEFNTNLKQNPILPVKGSPHGSPMLRSGGKSDKTKEIRSVTPLGFAYAFFEANH